MDLKFRFTQQGNSGSQNRQSLGAQSQEAMRKSSKSGLSKYKKKTNVGNAPDNQFKKYMLQANNIFYENRPQAHKLEDLKACRLLLIAFWSLMALSYILIGQLRAYQGVCPQNARCGVYVHCAQFFEYHGQTNTCVLSSDIIEQIQDICEAQIKQLQYNYGDNQCTGNQNVPILDINKIFADVGDESKRLHYQKEAKNFFRNAQKQEQYGFITSWNQVKPTVKLYSLSCRLTKFFSSPHRQLDLLYFFIIAVGVGLIARWFKKRRQIQNMYNFLRERVLKATDQTLNVTHTMTDLQAEFGQIDEETWKKINDVRTGKKEIGFYEDDFLYWKKM